jgi:hypothetical protein
MDASLLNRSMRLSVAEGGLAAAMSSLFSGVFLTGFALSLGATPVQIGILFALPSLCNLAQLQGSYWIERSGHYRHLCLWTTAACRLLYLPVLLVPLLGLGLSGPTRVWCIVGLMAVAGILSSLGGLAWLTWIKALVPSSIRVAYFGRRNLANTALSFLACLACGLAVDLYAVDEGSKRIAFAAVFGVAMGCGLAGFVLLARIPAVQMPRVTEHDRRAFGRTLAAPLVEPNFRRVVLFYATWNLAVNVAAPFYTVFFLQRLGLPLVYIVLLNTLNTVAGLATNNLWARLGQRFGMKPIVLLATIGDAFYPLFLVFVSPHWTWVLLLVHLTGVFNTPVTIGPDNFILKLQPDRGGSAYAAVFRAVVGPATALAAALGGWLAGSVSGGGLAAAGASDGLTLVFLISFAARLASLVLLAGVVEPDARPARHVVRVIQRRLRRDMAGRIGAWRAAEAPMPHLAPKRGTRHLPARAPGTPEGTAELPAIIAPVVPSMAAPVQG